MTTQCSALLAHRTLAEQDVDAIKGWFKHHPDKEKQFELLSTIGALPKGSCYIYSPAWLEFFGRVEIRLRHTFDSAATPKLGVQQVVPKTAHVDLKVLEARMAETIERSKADDPKELRKQIAELRKQLSANTVDPAAIEKAEARGYDKARGQWADLYEAVLDELVHLRKQVQTIADISTGLLSRDDPKTSPVRDIPVPAHRPAPVVHKPAAIAHKPVNSSHRADSSLSGAERRILTVLAQYPAGKDNTALAHLAGYTVNGHFNNMLGSLRSKGYANRGNPVTATPEGVAALGDYEPLPSGEDLRNYWRNKVSSSERRILDPLLDVYPNGLEPVELARRAGYTVNGHFNNMLGHLRTIEIVQRGSPIRASDTLFE